MNGTLWRKAIFESRLLFAATILLVFSFMWIFVWITSMVKLGPLYDFLQALPSEISGTLGAPIDQVATVAGRIGLSYVDPVIVFTSAVWGIARGSDVVSGEISRGSMEMLLALPVRRLTVLLTHATVTVVGAALLATAAWLGTSAGVLTIDLGEPVSPMAFLPAATNLFSVTFFIAAIATMASSMDSYRWRTIGVVGSFYVLGLILKVMSRTTDQLGFLRYFTFLGAYEPQRLITHTLHDTSDAWMAALGYNSILLAMGTVAYGIAAVVFSRRDLPAPI